MFTRYMVKLQILYQDLWNAKKNVFALIAHHTVFTQHVCASYLFQTFFVVNMSLRV